MADLKTDEPAIIRAAAVALVHMVLGFLVLHGVIGDVQAPVIEQVAVPFIAGLLTLGVGVAIRSRVWPDPKVQALAVQAEHATAKADAGLADADYARLGQLVRDELALLTQAEAPTPAPAVAATAADLTPHVEVPDGMAAGAPA